MTPDYIMLITIIGLLTVHVVLRFAATAARKSAHEDVARHIRQEHARKERLDRLYGRESPK